MARHEEEREDLYNEFRSAVLKWELQIEGSWEKLVCGNRKDGRFSIYFDQEHCYHFNANLQLLRAYRDGSLYRSQGTTLAKLTRERSEHETVLRRVDLSESELEIFLNELQKFLRELHNSLGNLNDHILRSDPAGSHLDSLESTIAGLCATDLQLAPAYATKRK